MGWIQRNSSLSLGNAEAFFCHRSTGIEPLTNEPRYDDLMFDTDAHLYPRARAYVEATATPRESLAAASGISERDLAAIEAAGALPNPTYVIFVNAVRSPIRTLGEPTDDGGAEYYCPAVLSWLRRAALIWPSEPGLSERLKSWFAGSLRNALQAQATAARQFAWSHLFGANGAISEAALEQEAGSLHANWMNGGWAVCLRRWNGDHVVTKDLERARIGALTQDAMRELNTEERLQLLDAIERLDSVILPFAPHERPHGTPGLFIDRMRERYGV